MLNYFNAILFYKNYIKQGIDSSESRSQAVFQDRHFLKWIQSDDGKPQLEDKFLLFYKFE